MPPLGEEYIVGWMEVQHNPEAATNFHKNLGSWTTDPRQAIDGTIHAYCTGLPGISRLRFYRDRAWSHQGVTTFGRGGHEMPHGGGNEVENRLVGRHYENPARHLIGHP